MMPNSEPVGSATAFQAPAIGSRAKFVWPLFLIAFGFLLASFPARNPDVWGHLANGRSALNHLELRDSFTPLFDAILFAGHALGGEFLVVFTKALSVGLLGVILFNTSRLVLRHIDGLGSEPDALATLSRQTSLTRPAPKETIPNHWRDQPLGSLGVSALIVGLALLAVSLRANLQPQTATYLLLALTAFGLQRFGTRPMRKLDWAFLALLALAWVNLDRGFVYGLAVIATVGVGHRLDRSPPTAPRHFYPILFGISIAACVLNPAHWTGEFPLPLELRWITTRGAAGEMRSPMTLAYFQSVRESPAALAYYPLLLLSALGFVWNRGGFRWERFLPSALFAGLSMASDRAIPLFAIVAAPVAAMNLSEAWARRSHIPTKRIRAKWLGYSLRGFLAAAFLIAAWPGWLQRAPYEPRRWAFDLSPSPALAADFLRKAKTPEGRTLHLTEESRRVFRWHCPEDDGGFDPQLVSELLEGRPVDDAMRSAKIERIALYHPDAERLRPALNALLRDRYRWPLLHLRGGVAIFGRRDPSPDSENRVDEGIELMATRMPELDGGRPPVPRSGPDLAVPPLETSLQAVFTRPRSVQSEHREEAALLLVMADVSQRWIPKLSGLAWPYEQTAGLIGATVTAMNPLQAATGALLRLNYASPQLPDPGRPSRLFQLVEQHFEYTQASRDDFLPGTLPASIRAGRRATGDDSGDSAAWLLLSEAYWKLMADSRERVWIGEFKQLGELRQAQIATALRRAIEASPSPSARMHGLSSLMFRQMGHLDLGLEHLEAARAVERRNARGVPPDAAAAKADQRYRDDVKKLRDQYDRESAGLRVVDQTRLAEELHLPGLALELLLKSDIAAFGVAGLKQQVELMVRTGRSQQVIEWMAPEQKDSVGLRNYHWWRAQAFAGLGDYDSADRELIEIGGGAGDLIPDPALLVTRTATLVGKNVLGESPQGRGLPDAIARAYSRSDAVTELTTMETRLKNLAEVSALRGILALEIGDWSAAKQYGEAAKSFTPVRSDGTATTLRQVGQSLVDRSHPPK